MKPIIVANWKANKTLAETAQWVEKTKAKLQSLSKIQVVVCGPFVVLPSLHNLFTNSSIKVGAQNVSHLGSGAFTGEVTVEMLEDLVEYCIVGHSERKKYFAETPEMIMKKVEILVGKNIIPVLCIADLNQLDAYLLQSKILVDQAEKIIFVFEPPSAISGGGDYHPETPETADTTCQKMKEKIGKDIATIYGGSVNPDNIVGFLSKKNIHGALPGQASLDPDIFVKLISQANEAVV